MLFRMVVVGKQSHLFFLIEPVNETLLLMTSGPVTGELLKIMDMTVVILGLLIFEKLSY